jgi:hypothetical protein
MQGSKALQRRFWRIDEQESHQILMPVYNWLILVFGEPLKTTDLSAMLLQKDGAGGGKECRLRPCFPYQKDWK